MALILLKKSGYVTKEIDRDGTMMLNYSRLSEEEVHQNQVKLARGVLVFMEILHLLIARNRDMLLTVVENRKRSDSASFGLSRSQPRERTLSRELTTIAGSPNVNRRQHERVVSNRSETPVHSRGFSALTNSPSHDRGASQASSIPSYDRGVAQMSTISSSGEPNREGSRTDFVPQPPRAPSKGDKTDSSIAIQSELQRQFVSMAKTVYPMISGILRSETPRWLKQCSQDNYFSSYTYRQTKVCEYSCVVISDPDAYCSLSSCVFRSRGR